MLVAPLLRLKIRLGDADSRVIGICFDSLLAVKPDNDSVALVRSYSEGGSEPLRAEALGALARSNHDAAAAAAVSMYQDLNDDQLRRIVVTAMGASHSVTAQAFLLERLSAPLHEAEWALEALLPKLQAGPDLDRVELALRERDDVLLARFMAWRSGVHR
ncbi:MAG: hypothetical protein JSV66_11310 [Trueperaceae bacterium]|nr:MAG: hypothetical protein JSV66_11310 [Trueperaceae bacterium]